MYEQYKKHWTLEEVNFLNSRESWSDWVDFPPPRWLDKNVVQFVWPWSTLAMKQHIDSQAHVQLVLFIYKNAEIRNT